MVVNDSRGGNGKIILNKNVSNAKASHRNELDVGALDIKSEKRVDNYLENRPIIDCDVGS